MAADIDQPYLLPRIRWGDIADEMSIEHVDLARWLNIAGEAFGSSQDRIMYICCELSGSFAVAGKHAFGIKFAAANQDQGLKAAWLATGCAGHLLGPGSSVGIAVFVELNRSVYVGGSAAPIRMNVFAVSSEAGLIGKELLLYKRMKTRILLRSGYGWRLFGLRSGQDGIEREKGYSNKRRQAEFLWKQLSEEEDTPAVIKMDSNVLRHDSQGLTQRWEGWWLVCLAKVTM